MISQKNLFRFGSFLFIFLLSIMFTPLLRFYYAKAAEEKKNDPNAATGAPAVPVYIPPLPRHVEFPAVIYGKKPSVEGEAAINLSTMSFWYVAVLASWNPRSSEIANILNKNYENLGLRKVGVIGLYSNDTVDSIENWRKKFNPLFFNEFASRNLLDTLKNPKIPTVWVIGRQGEVLQRLEMPTKQDMIESIEKVMKLTDF